MAIKANKGNEVVTNEVKLYTGVATVRVVAVNPDMAKMQEMGMKNVKDEPQYVSDAQEGHKKVRLDFYLQSDKPAIKAKVSFWLEEIETITKAGDKKQFINHIAQATYATSEDALYEWFDKTDVRVAKRGEADLHEFLRAWANVKSGEECKVDVSPFFEGDFSELETYVGMLSINEIKVLLGVRVADNGNTYQDVYNRHFERSYTKNTKGWIKKLSDSYSTYKNDYQGDLQLKEYSGPTTVTPSNGSVPTGSDDPLGGGGSEDTDGLEF